MALTYGFFNSVNGDRTYNADSINYMFEGLLSNGVFQNVGSKLVVSSTGAMSVSIGTGRGWFAGRWVKNDSPLTLDVLASDVTLNRYGAVVIKVDNTDSVRAVSIYIKYGEFATTPTKPTMDRGAYVNEYCLAYIYIPARATTILNDNIEDTRQSANLCGWVTGLIDQITPETLYNQFTAQFNSWFSTIEDTLDTNVETTLVNAMAKNVTVTLNPNNWVNGSQTVPVNGVKPTSSVIVQSDNSYIKCVGQGVNTITFIADIVPSTSVSVDVTFMA